MQVHPAVYFFLFSFFFFIAARWLLCCQTTTSSELLVGIRLVENNQHGLVYNNSCSTCNSYIYYTAFCGSRGSCVKSDKLPQVMSLESASVGAEDQV